MLERSHETLHHDVLVLDWLRPDKAELKAGEAPTTSVAVANPARTPQVGLFSTIRPSAC